MSILILGSTGGTGSHLVGEALRNGYEVYTIARQPDQLSVTDPLLHVLPGAPDDPKLLAQVLPHCDTILSALNISRSSMNPWSGLITPPDLMSRTMARVVELGGSGGLKRLMVVSAWGVNESYREIPFWFKALVKWSNIGAAYKDHARQEAVLKSSGMVWTAIRPTGLTDSKNSKNIEVSINGDPKPTLTISRQNVARFMINELEEREYLNQAITISEA